MANKIIYQPDTGQFLVVPASGGGGGTYTGASPTTVTVGGLAAGTNIAGLTFSQILEAMLVPYIAPNFTGFSISGQTSPVEVGTVISGTKSFAFGFTDITHVLANSLTIRDVTTSTNLATGQSTTSPVSVSVGTITNTSPATHSWQGIATNTAPTPATFTSSLFTVSWFYRRFSGTNTNPTLTSTDVQALANSQLNAGFAQTSSLAAGGYKYFVWSNTFGSPTAVSGFKDTSNNLPVSMAGIVDGYTSTDANGWNYLPITFTNGLGVSATYRIYRTKNQLGGAITIQVS